MKRSWMIKSFLIGTSLTLSVAACEKQDSQQPNVSATTSDARHDLANQPSSGPETNAPTSQEQITTNPNSGRANADTTIETSQGAAVVSGINMNPSSPTPAPTSVNVIPRNSEPMTDAAVNAVNCRDAIANDYGGRSAPNMNTCPPTAQSRIKSGATDHQATR